MIRLLIASVALVTMAIPASAHRYHHHHHRHHHASRHHTRHYSCSGCVQRRLDDGQIITISAAHAAKFVGFLNALFHREGRLAPVNCAASGHMRHSLHHWGGACDVGQRARNVAWRAMYHVGSLARQFGLTDGCVWRHPDCGHVDVSGTGGYRYAHRYRSSPHRIVIASRHRIYARTRHRVLPGRDQALWSTTGLSADDTRGSRSNSRMYGEKRTTSFSRVSESLPYRSQR